MVFKLNLKALLAWFSWHGLVSMVLVWKACRNPPWPCRDRDRSYFTEALACLMVFELRLKALLAGL